MTAIIGRYARAVGSGNLAMDAGRLHDADVLLAAGMSGGQTKRFDGAKRFDDEMGMALLRLRAEAGPVLLQELDADAGDVTARVLVLSRLRGLVEVRQQLARSAARAVVRLKTDLTAERRAQVVGATLQAWLWPRCDVCRGLGELGAYGSPRRKCKACGGSGRKRDHSMGLDEDKLRACLLVQMDVVERAAQERLQRAYKS
jgi:DnaJ-class molecular chaperone